MRNGGEACTSANRFHVAESVAGDFAERLAARLGELRVGRGTDDGVQVGPLIDDDQRGKVAELVEDAVGKGAKVLVGGRRARRAGLLLRADRRRRRARRRPDAARGDLRPGRAGQGLPRPRTRPIAAANDTEYGLVAYVYTQDVSRAFRVIERLETGMVGFNQGMVSNAGAPFGGVKQSGYGREGGPEGLREYLETKYVAMNV